MAKSREKSLLDLPTDLLLPNKKNETSITSVASKSDAKKIMGKLSSTCSTLHTLFKPVLNDILQKDAEELLQYVLKPTKENLAKAKTMYEKNPRLLFIEATATEDAADLDGVHRTIVNSPFRAALGAGDFLLAEEMIKSLANCVDPQSKKTGRQIADEQFDQQFPNGVDYPPSTYDFSALVQAISNDPILIAAGLKPVEPGEASEATEALLAQLREHFKPGVVRFGHHFNMNDLIKVREIYCANTTWNYAQDALFWSQVNGFLERLVSGFGGQIQSFGVVNFLNNPASFHRDDEIQNYVTNKKIVYFPLDADPSYRLGINFGVNNYGWHDACSRWNVADRAIIELCRTNTNSLEKIKQQLQQPTNSHLQEVNHRRGFGCQIV